jgi:ribosomal protein S6
MRLRTEGTIRSYSLGEVGALEPWEARRLRKQVRPNRRPQPVINQRNDPPPSVINQLLRKWK